MTLLFMVAMGGAVSVFLGSATITEKESFALVFGASGLRFLGVLGTTLFCCFYVRRSFETKEVEFLLSRPLSRTTFLFSHATAFIALALSLAISIGLVVFFLGKPSMNGFVVWLASLGVEYSIIAVAALFFSMVVSSASGSALCTLGFYTLARMMGTILGISHQAPSNAIFAVLNNIAEMISIFVPRLDLMGQTSWLVYGVAGSGGIGFTEEAGNYAHMMVAHLGILGFISLQGAVFIALLLAATAFDFIRREF
ncbi:MAG: hypothetical protein PW788_05095 [Micavibrio sp.]|nr:hypothetical protein [Micavibrio sp.]